MHDIVSSTTSYGLGVFAFLFTQDIAVYAAFFGVILVVVRIAGDLPRAIQAWKDLFKGDDEDGSDDG